jgi:N-methylhydantoinase A/oxoprolinase/acetone carboxylase beta subunit
MPAVTINIDTGGTFTDAFVVRGGATHAVKTLTTPHDLAVCFREVIERVAQSAGVTVRELLRETVAVRYSTTVGTNAVVQRTGPRLGLLAAAGGDRLYSGNGAAERVFELFLREDMVVVVGDGDGVADGCKALLEQCARGLVCAMPGSDATPQPELAVRQEFERHYPRHCLDAVPLLLSHEIATDPDDFRRTATALFNAYVHPDVASFLYRAEDHLREHDYRRPLLIVRSDGGCARVAKTIAAHTYNSGPAAGLAGAQLVARHYGIGALATFDMGGTSLDVAFLEQGEPVISEYGDVEGVEVSFPLPELLVLGAGGGSIAHLDGGELRVGPRSAGAKPGPACFGFGGTEPTVTDANVVLGIIDPERFLGGKMQLDPARARTAIESLGGDAVERAAEIRTTLDAEVGMRIADGLRVRGLDPASTVMLAYGGAGPMHACSVAQAAGINAVVTVPFAAVFSAYGASSADLEHTYLDAPGPGVEERLRERALRDMRGEGFAAEDVSFEADVVKRHGQERVLVKATAPLEHGDFAPLPAQNGVPVLRASREVHWPGVGAVATAIYAIADITPCHRIDGPVIVEADDTTCVVPDGWSFEIDDYGNPWMRASETQ